MNTLQANAFEFSIQLLGEAAMVAFGAELGRACLQRQVVIFLDGDLGMGKTTLSRGVLQAFGHQGAVKSPTYTLVEPYEFNDASVYHFDLYRLGDPEELEYMGIRDYFESKNSLCLVEWAEKGAMFLPMADLVVRIQAISDGRDLVIVSQTKTGAAILKLLATSHNN
ncbi:tRNA (adenosine(37)-N6)-threonylcarbamoyltransferase complex ATPase subunit type 1 TsaE [Oceanicoccus sp. KOV_DT_Chl]|uniref:tRNA (adenosine(37)-N6)-threonylcarbamoyltransferase complex ATPase subunit type 1 TsaE n=1 Tax=Oceanicoccus sp. KOV_DT_Chl TaxID=1904639 RepID=UPI000C7BEEC8|nr:tRNA (adenosine(37)-N6)-threonylcarbamoyltransferase complex ATPase subunit type 1 TsaE [Oceanicoccus sp. KOV_DT_Chl]